MLVYVRNHWMPVKRKKGRYIKRKPPPADSYTFRPEPYRADDHYSLPSVCERRFFDGEVMLTREEDDASQLLGTMDEHADNATGHH